MNGGGTADSVLVRVRDLVAEIAGVDPCDVPDDAPLFDTDKGADGGLALDSLDALKLMLALSEEYGLGDPGDVDYEMIRTVGDVAEYVCGLKANGGGPWTRGFELRWRAAFS